MTDSKKYVFLNQAPFSFDLSVFDLYLAFYTGGTLYSLSREVQNNLNYLYAAFEASDINVWVSTPSFADVALSDKKFSEEILKKLKLFLFCGETLNNRTVKRLLRAFPNTDIINTYGPTESTVAVTSISITEEVNNEYVPLPVGKAKPGTKIIIMDERGNSLPDGESGEIVIVGDTVSIGYWRNELKTQEAFSVYKSEGKEYRLYHTHDKGHINSGLLYYEGRLDLQIKLRGYRIEIADIENNMMKLDEVQKGVVVPNYRNNEVKSLTAYIVSNESYEDEFKAKQCVKLKLREFLPDYMIPKKIIFVESIPMTNNGKVDRKMLGGLK